MGSYQPAYRLRLYKHRSLDLAETTVLTPAAGAAHSDAFQITTLASLVGYRSYMGLPDGRRGRIDVLSKQTDTGELLIPLLDAKAGVATDNLTRWITAFLGDSGDRNQLGGCKVVIEESLDGGGTWNAGGKAFFTGRVSRLTLDRSRLWYQLAVRDMAEILKGDVFIGKPHASVASYASLVSLLPIGPAAIYGRQQPVVRLRGTVASTDSGTGSMEVKLDAEETLRLDNVVTTNLVRAVGAPYVIDRTPVLGQTGSAPRRFTGTARAHLKRLDTSAEGEYYVGQVNWSYLPGPSLLLSSAGNRVVSVHLKPMSVGGLAIPPISTAVEFWIYRDGRMRGDNLLLVNDVHPAQLFRDLLDGYFGPLWTELDTADGAALPAGVSYGDPKRVIGYDATAFATLIADASFPVLRLPETQSLPLREVIEQQICQVAGLGSYLDGDGKVVPVDLRHPTSLAGVGTIGEAELALPDVPGWEYDATGAISSAAGTYYAEAFASPVILGLEGVSAPGYMAHGVFPTISDKLLTNTPIDVEVLGMSRETLIADAPFKIDALGLRGQPNEAGFDAWVNAFNRVNWAEQTLIRALRFPERMFSRGPAVIRLACRRTANTNDCFPGTLKVLDIDELPDPATNLRGGARLVRCLERAEQGLTVRLSFIDLGLSTSAVAPSLGTPTTIAGDTRNGAQVVVTLNASSQRAEVQFAVTTPATGTHPAEADSAWTRAMELRASGTVALSGLPAGQRIWFRARTFDLTGMLQPSAWAYSTSVTLAGLTTISGLTVSEITAASCLLTWTNGDATLAVAIYLASPITDPLTFVQLLPPGTTRWRLDRLAASTQYKVELRARDGVGGESAGVNTTVTTTATNPVCPDAGTCAIVLGSL